VIFGFSDGELIALHAFFKKSQKTGREDLLLARNRWEELA
jgi:phage-related protein